MLYLDKENFQAEIMDVSGKSFVMFSGDGCVPCEAIKPFVMQCAEKYGDKLRFAILNTTKAKRLSMSLKVMGLPAAVVYENGEELERLGKEGMNETSIEEMIGRHI
ncbi:MAG: thioredoxin family protein [Defluviitaleaceae bacterium]|nr:thioredoxin family protein [Defluviitaleaceae bacterium]